MLHNRQPIIKENHKIRGKCLNLCPLLNILLDLKYVDSGLGVHVHVINIRELLLPVLNVRRHDTDMHLALKTIFLQHPHFFRQMQ